MTTKREIRALMKSILARYSDIAVVNGKMGLQFVLKPVTHVNRGFMLWPTSSRDRAHHHWYLAYTFFPRSFGYGPFVADMFFDDPKEAYWSHPRYREAFAETLERKILPRLRATASVNEILAFDWGDDFKNKGWAGYPVHRLRMLIAAGRFDEAASEARSILGPRRSDDRDWYHPADVESTRQLWALVEARDLPAVAAILHGWERDYVERNGMAEIYEKTPFAFEL